MITRVRVQLSVEARGFLVEALQVRLARGQIVLLILEGAGERGDGRLRRVNAHRNVRQRSANALTLGLGFAQLRRLWGALVVGDCVNVGMK